MPPGKGQALAIHYSSCSSLENVAEVTVGSGDGGKLDCVVCTVDYGVPINPGVIRAEAEGGVGFGIGAILFGANRLKEDRVEQSNFNEYRVLRMNEMPKSRYTL